MQFYTGITFSEGKNDELSHFLKLMKSNSILDYIASNPYSFESIGEKIRKENQEKIYKN